MIQMGEQEVFAMPAPLALRADYDASTLRRLARGSTNANQTRRLLALASIYDGAPRSAAARIGGVTPQIIRNWVVRFNTEGPDGLIDRKAPGSGVPDTWLRSPGSSCRRAKPQARPSL